MTTENSGIDPDILHVDFVSGGLGAADHEPPVVVYDAFLDGEPPDAEWTEQRAETLWREFCLLTGVDILADDPDFLPFTPTESAIDVQIRGTRDSETSERLSKMWLAMRRHRYAEQELRGKS